MSAELSGKAAIVTGAAGGIGAACARCLAEAGAAVVLVDVRADDVEASAADIAAAVPGARVSALALDVTSERDMATMAQETLRRHDRIDALVAAAGILRAGGQPKTVADTSFEEWSRVIGVNLTGTFLSNRAVLSAMLAQGEGDIVNISSTSGRQGRAFDGAYCASKFGIVGLSEALAEEVGRQGVRVQTVLPDAVDTPLWEQNGGAALRPRDFLSPQRIASLVVFLITLPRDTYLFNTTVYPTRQRRRRATGGATGGRQPSDGD